jgi:hypothetical protein
MQHEKLIFRCKTDENWCQHGDGGFPPGGPLWAEAEVSPIALAALRSAGASRVLSRSKCATISHAHAENITARALGHSYLRR